MIVFVMVGPSRCQWRPSKGGPTSLPDVSSQSVHRQWGRPRRPRRGQHAARDEGGHQLETRTL